MKKLIVLITLVSSIIITGCSNNKDFMITSEKLTENESLLLSLTGNRVAKYNLKNLPTDKTFDLALVYEVYKNGEKVKDDQIFAMGFGPTDEKLEDTILAINIEDNKIRCISGGAYTYLPIEEDITKLSYAFLTPNNKIQVGDEIYLYQGFSNGSGFIVDSPRFSEEDKQNCINSNDLAIFLKLTCK